eukprot:3524090-Rhodomonas_salina.1
MADSVSTCNTRHTPRQYLRRRQDTAAHGLVDVPGPFSAAAPTPGSSGRESVRGMRGALALGCS